MREVRWKEELKESWKLKRAFLIQIAVEWIIAKLKTNSAWRFNISPVEAITNDRRFPRDNVKFPFSNSTLRNHVIKKSHFVGKINVTAKVTL